MEIKLNLASKPYLNRQSVRLWLLPALLFMVVVLLLNCFYVLQNFRQQQLLDARFQELEAQVAGVQGTPVGYTQEKHTALLREVAVTNDLIASDQFHWTALLDRFEKLIPADVSIRTIQPDFNARTVQLTCVARDVSAMTLFLDNLLGSADLNQAYLKRQGEVEAEAGGRTQTLISFSLEIREAF